MKHKNLRPELLEAIARKTIKSFDPRLLTDTTKEIPIEDIIERLGISLEYQYIRKDGRILGETIFSDCHIPLYNMDQKKYELVFIPRGTIIIDASLLEQGNNGRLRFTCAHELAHWLIHQELYGPGAVGHDIDYIITKSSDVDQRIERQADILASALLMPINMVKRSFYRIAGNDDIKTKSLAEEFCVSRQAMEIRLREHRLI